MDDADLVVRAKAYFDRQIAWFEHRLTDLESLERDLTDEELDPLVRQQARHADEMARLESEFWAMARDWQDAAHIAPADREAVHALAQRAEALAAQLRAAHSCAQAAVAQRLGTLETAWQALRKGRVLLNTYRVPDAREGDWMDKTV